MDTLSMSTELLGMETTDCQVISPSRSFVLNAIAYDKLDRAP
jgi:hypothetical protein